MSAPAPEASAPAANSRGWVEPLLWSVAMIAFVIISACVNEVAREVLMQALAYLFTFLTTPFLLETTSAVIGILIVFMINNRRIAREGDGWVMMEVKTEELVEKKETAV